MTAVDGNWPKPLESVVNVPTTNDPRLMVTDTPAGKFQTADATGSPGYTVGYVVTRSVNENPSCEGFGTDTYTESGNESSVPDVNVIATVNGPTLDELEMADVVVTVKVNAPEEDTVTEECDVPTVPIVTDVAPDVVDEDGITCPATKPDPVIVSVVPYAPEKLMGETVMAGPTSNILSAVTPPNGNVVESALVSSATTSYDGIAGEKGVNIPEGLLYTVPLSAGTVKYASMLPDEDAVVVVRTVEFPGFPR
jgi:hypothetical protein